MMDPTPPPVHPAGARRRLKPAHYLGAVIAALAMLIATAIPAAAADLMRVTFIRHGQSYGNLSGNIDTSTPGPVLTDLGTQQAEAVAKALGDNNYDGIYASEMVRTQLTAAPMSQYLGLPIRVLPGIQEIEAGIFEGTPEASAASGYGGVLIKWATGIPPYGIPQDKSIVMPGTTLDGYQFDARMRAGLQTIYDNGDRNAAVFSHGGAIMFWTLMNVTNLTIAEKFNLIASGASLSNTDSVVIEGNNEDGWTLVRWKDQQFAPEPTFWNQVKLQNRTLNRQLAAAWQQVKDAFASHDFGTIATAFSHAIADSTISLAKYHRAVNAIVVEKLKKIFTPAPAPAPAAPANPVAPTNAAKAAPQAVAPAAEPAPAARVATLAGANKVDAKVETSAEAKVEAPAEADAVAEVEAVAPLKAVAGTETTAKDAGTEVPKDKAARVERPSHKVRDTAKRDDDQGTTAAPKRSDRVKKSAKSPGSADGGTQRDAA